MPGQGGFHVVEAWRGIGRGRRLLGLVASQRHHVEIRWLALPWYAGIVSPRALDSERFIVERLSG
jgi:hypothetical protein